MRPKKLFLCSYAISRSQGSEAGVGFGWLLAARQAWDGKIFLLCGVCDPHTRHAIELLGNIEIVEFGVLFDGQETITRFCEKPIFRFLIHNAYQNWLDRVARYVGVGSSDDIFHYVNFVGFRFKLNLRHFEGRVVRGPVGGAAYSSWKNILSAPFLTSFYLCVRNLKNWIDVLRVKNAYHHEFSFVIYATSADKMILDGNNCPSAIHSEIVIDDELFPTNQIQKSNDTILITWVGECTALKNPYSLLRILEYLSQAGYKNFNCVMFFKKSNLKTVRKLKERYEKLAGLIEFVVDAPRDQVLARLRRSHLYVNLSRKDLTSTALAEAMINQAIPIVVSRNGFVDVVDLTTGILLQEENVEGHLFNILIRFMIDDRTFDAFVREVSASKLKFGVSGAVEILRGAYGAK